MTKPMLVLHNAAMIGLLFCATFVLWAGFSITWPYEVIHINSLKVIGTEVEVGDYLEYSLDYCKSKEFSNLRAQVQLSFRDGVIYNLPLESGPLPAGCTTAIFVLAVPAIPEGKYHLEMAREYSINPLRKIEVRAVSNVFKVSGKRRLNELLRKQLPEVIPEVIPQIPQIR